MVAHHVAKLQRVEARAVVPHAPDRRQQVPGRGEGLDDVPLARVGAHVGDSDLDLVAGVHGLLDAHGVRGVEDAVAPGAQELARCAARRG